MRLTNAYDNRLPLLPVKLSAEIMFRTRFKKDIVAEFLPPRRSSTKQKVIILCDGMPSVPRKQPLAEFLADQGYWVFYPRYRGAWESGGQFLEHSPHEDILHVIDELPRGVTELAFGRRFRPQPDEIFVIGGSFGGAVAILASLDRRVKKVVATCPVVDWSILAQEEKLETSNPSYAAYIRESVWVRLSPERQELEKTSYRQVLQSRRPPPQTHTIKDHDVPCSGRSLHSLSHGKELCGNSRDQAQIVDSWRPREDGIHRPQILGHDQRVLCW